jgi:hypothetical protein
MSSIAISGVESCADAILLDFENFLNYRPDVQQDFARDHLHCLTHAVRLMDEPTTSYAGVDRLGRAFNAAPCSDASKKSIATPTRPGRGGIVSTRPPAGPQSASASPTAFGAPQREQRRSGLRLPRRSRRPRSGCRRRATPSASGRWPRRPGAVSGGNIPPVQAAVVKQPAETVTLRAAAGEAMMARLSV